MRLNQEVRDVGQFTSRKAMGGMGQVFNDPEVQDQIAREMVEVARLQKQCLILKRSNAALRAQKTVKQQSLLKKLD